MSSGPFISRAHADAEYTAYNDYLAKTDVLRKFSSSIAKLYATPAADRPRDPINFLVQDMNPAFKNTDLLVARQKRIILIQSLLQRIKKHMEKQEELRRRQIAELYRAHHQIAAKSPRSADRYFMPK